MARVPCRGDVLSEDADFAQKNNMGLNAMTAAPGYDSIVG